LSPQTSFSKDNESTEPQILAEKCIFKIFLAQKRIEHPDICPTGMVFLVSFTLVGAEHQLRRFIALKPKDKQEGRSI
jgi:hypothetical protein